MPSDDALAQLRSANFRDLGGLPTRDGTVLAPGAFFRSSNLEQLYPTHARAIGSLQIHTAVDLRTPKERRVSDSLPACPSARILSIPLFINPRDNWIAPRDQSPAATARRYLEMLSDGIPSLVNIVHQLAHPATAPFVIFCAAGRDRTGIVVACLLDLLQVEADAIAVDYSLSDSFIQDGGRAHPGTIVELLRLIRSQFGSTRDLLLQHRASPAAIATFGTHLRVRP